MKFATLLAGALSFALSSALPEPIELDKRQNDNCGRALPTDFKAFNLGGCRAQLTWNRVRDVGVEWYFDAYFADGSRQTFRPQIARQNIAVSDPLYTTRYGNNFITDRLQSTRFTSVHEFSSICRNNNPPVSWVFRSRDLVDETNCFTSSRIATTSGSRPGRANFSGRQLNQAGDIELTWNAVDGAANYTVFVEIPTTVIYTANGGYYKTDRGFRVGAGTTRAVLPGVVRNGMRNNGVERKLFVNVQNAQGVWSNTLETVPISVVIN